MERIVSRLEVTPLVCDVDDFCQTFEWAWAHQPQWPAMPGEKRSRSRLRLSEVMTIVIAFHASGARTFKDFYPLTVLPHWRKAFALPSQLQPICGTDAVGFDAVVLFSDDPTWRDDWNFLCRFHPD